MEKEDKKYKHQPIMGEVILHNLNIKSNSIFCDMTLGEGGHALLFLSKLNNQGIFIGLDRNKDILNIAKDRLKKHVKGVKYILKNENFSKIDELLKNIKNEMKHEIEKIDYFFYDLGISMYHLKNMGYGFSFKDDKSLNMNLDNDYKYTASEIINTFPEPYLANIFFRYAEEGRSRFFAKEIVEYRKKKRIISGKDLGDIFLRFGRRKIHPATKIFQALRIFVNNEFYHLITSLYKAIKLLSINGKIAVLTFHSFEDRIVKKIFLFFEKLKIHYDFSNFSFLGIIKKVNKKVIQVSYEEKKIHSASRSAKLRIIEKIMTLNNKQWEEIWIIYKKQFKDYLYLI